jgi:hypothetical protein
MISLRVAYTIHEVLGDLRKQLGIYLTKHSPRTSPGSLLLWRVEEQSRCDDGLI